MKRFIAYFDFMGYKNFILNNDSTHLKRRAEHILRDIEDSLAQGKYQEREDGITVADLSLTKINCLNISDAVIFWTNDDSIENLKELLLVAYRFNWKEILYNFPVRGVIYCDQMEIIYGQNKNQVESIYSPNLIYGRGLVKAHLKTENLNWAGCVIDATVIDQIKDTVNVEKFLEPFAKQYKIPYKKQYALLLNKEGSKLNEVAFEETKKGIINAFSSDNKPIDNPRTQELLNNTIAYLETFRE